MSRMIRVALVVFVIILMLVSAVVVHAQEQFPPRPSGFVSDNIGAFTTQQVMELDQLGGKLHASTGATLIVATVNDCGADPQSYGKNLFDYWQIGDATRQDGFLYLFCWNNGVKAPSRAVVYQPGRNLASVWSKERTSPLTAQFVRPALAQDKSASTILSGNDLGKALFETYKMIVGQMMPAPVVPAQQAAAQPQPVQSQPVQVQTDSGNWTVLGISLPWWVWTLGVLFLIVLAVAFLFAWRKNSGTSYGGDSGSYSTSYSPSYSNDRFTEGYTLGRTLGGSSHESSPSNTPSYTPPSSPPSSFGSEPSYGGKSGFDSGPTFGGGSSGGGSSDSV